MKFGLLALVAAFGLVLNSQHYSATAATAEDMELTFGGGCQYCGVGGLQCADQDCKARKGDEGPFAEYDGEDIDEAECKSKQKGGVKECEENTKTLCITSKRCTDAACTKNCKTRTRSVKNDCETAGACSDP